MRSFAWLLLPLFGVLLWHGVLGITGTVRYDFDLRSGETADGPAVAEGNVGVPLRIRIPSIAVDAAIGKAALTAAGAMDVPKDPLETVWFELGPRPGEAGSAAIAGHVDWLKGARGVFADLHKVKVGDTITVQDDQGADVSFVVRESRKYDAAADALDVFSSQDGKAHLNIITCAGAWDKRAKRYPERLVVFADKAAD